MVMVYGSVVCILYQSIIQEVLKDDLFVCRGRGSTMVTITTITITHQQSSMGHHCAGHCHQVISQ